MAAERVAGEGLVNLRHGRRTLGEHGLDLPTGAVHIALHRGRRHRPGVADVISVLEELDGDVDVGHLLLVRCPGGPAGEALLGLGKVVAIVDARVGEGLEGLEA